MANLEWPSDLGRGTLIGRLLWMQGDTSDPDRDPDLSPITDGKVTVQASVSEVRYTGEQGTALAVKRLTTGILDSEGYICTPAPSGDYPTRGIVVPATDSPLLTPTDFTYKVTIEAGTYRTSFNIKVPTGSTVDLVKAAPVAASGGTAIVVDGSAADRAEEAATRAETAAAQAEESIPTFGWDGTRLVIDGESGPDLRGPSVTWNDLAEVFRPREVTTATINELLEPGMYQATSAASVNLLGSPAPGERMTYEVISEGSPAIVTQIARSQVTPKSFWRVRQISGVWSAWAGGLNAMLTLGTTDMNTLTVNGTYLLVNGTALAASANLATPNRQIIRVQTALLPYTTQEVVDLTTGRTYSRANNNGIWSPWNSTATLSDITEPDPVVVGIDSAGAGGTNALLVEDWSRRMGGRKRIDTGAIALRFDHGLSSFNSKIRPLLEARNLPYSLALNAGNWGHSENTGVTKEMVNSWVQGGLCEIWNHSLTHNSTSDPSQWRREIVDGLTQLRADLPAAQIDGWAVPSLQGIGYVDPEGTYLTGASVSEYYDTPAGRLILATHAVATGYIPGTFQRVLDGTPRQSQLHWTFDKSTLAQIQGLIATAETQKRGLQLMLHPSLVDTADHITTATVEQILDYIVTERDAGRLTVLGPYDLMLADAT